MGLLCTITYYNQEKKSSIPQKTPKDIQISHHNLSRSYKNASFNFGVFYPHLPPAPRQIPLSVHSLPKNSKQ